jgi:hypothetical protein
MPHLVPHIRAVSTLPPGSRALLATPLFLLALTASAHADPLFSAPFLSYDSGAGPRSVAIADLNADGRPDLAVANSGSDPFAPGTVSVLLGNADGTLGAKTDFGAGITPYALAIADLDADGRADLAVANFGSSTVSVLLGNGDGTFGTKTDFATGPAPRSVAIADLNADGWPDLAVTYGASPVALSVLLGNGDGTFADTTDFGNGGGPRSVATADLNADGRPDLAVTNGLFFVSVLLANGDGTFARQTNLHTGNNPSSVAIADLNADGHPDLAVSNSGSNSVSVLLGNGDGTFAARRDFGTGSSPSSVAIADLNGDGRPDLAVANANSSTVSVLLAGGDSTFTAKTDFHTGGNPASVAIADFNADGRPDLAVANAGSSTVAMLIGNGDGSFGITNEFGTGAKPSSVAIADLNADGRPDLAVANSGEFSGSPSTVSVLLGVGDGTFGTKTDFGVGINPSSVAIADLNADGKPDLVVPNNYFAGTVSVLLGNGDGTFGTKTDFDTGDSPPSVAIADFNADGRPDLAVPTSSSDAISVLLGNGDGTFGAKTDFGTAARPVSLACADLNADGKPDLVVACPTVDPRIAIGRVSVLLGNGDGTFGTHTEFGFNPASSPGAVAIGDLNGDARPDLALVPVGSSSVGVLLGNGDGTFGAQTDFGTGSYSSSVAIADLNADGRPDLAVTNGSAAVSVLLGNGDGTFGPKTNFGTGLGPSPVVIADVNADGRPDLAVASYSSNSVSVLLNRGPYPPIAMAFDFTPGTLNLASHGLWVTGYLEPPSPFAAGAIDIASIRLNGTVPVDPAAPTAIADHDGNGVPDLMVKFNRAAVELTLTDGDHVPVTVTGTVAGHTFIGTDYIRVRRAVVSAPAAGSHLTAGTVTQVLWETPDGITVESVALLLSLDGGSTWSLIAEGQPNSGSYGWTVPDVQTDQAKVAVVLVESADATGEIVDGVLGVSEAFSIEGTVGVGDRAPAKLALAIRGGTPSRAAGGRLWVEFSLRDVSPARLELADVAGRVLSTKQVGSLGPGPHALDLSEGGALRPGIYFLRLTQGGKEVRARAAVIR